MGCVGSKKKQLRICMVGLDSAGKTTVLYQMTTGSEVPTEPTIGFNVETVVHNNIEFTVWDVGGQHKIRPSWTDYLLVKKISPFFLFFLFLFFFSLRHSIWIFQVCMPLLIHTIFLFSFPQKCQVVIFVVDSNDTERLSEAAEELSAILKNDALKHCPFIVLANKQDLPKAIKEDELKVKFALENLTGRTWKIQPTCAKTGQGLKEALDWIAANASK
jgi:ADP-ribosylation factor protein 1